jgi:hypothetical protein
MSEQYAFAIGFDFESSSDEMGGQAETETATLAEIEAALRSTGLPDIDGSDRWDEFGQGRIFWGTKPECDNVKQVLSQFKVFLQEERNLESGYYATPASTYYVDEAGNLYRLINPSDHSAIGSLESIMTIPLDAYRLRTIDPNLQAAVERSLSSFSNPTEPPLPSERPKMEGIAENTALFEIAENAESPNSSGIPHDIVPTPQPSEEELAALQAQVVRLTSEIEALQFTSDTKMTEAKTRQSELQNQIALKATQINELERQVTDFEDQIVSLQSVTAAKIDPELHANQQIQLTQQIQRLETQLMQAETQAKEWQAKAEAFVDPQVHAQLQKQLSIQTSKVQELQQILQRLEQQLKETSAIAAQKVEPARYEALEQSIADKTALIIDLRQHVNQLERDLSEWRTVAESKVDWTEYQALQEQFRQLQKRKRGLFSRLFSWLFG